MTKLSPEAQAMLDAGRDAISPTAATKASVLQSIDASLATGTAVAGSGAFAVGKLALALTLIAGIGGGWLLFRQSDSVSNAEAPAQAVVVETAEVTTPTPIVAVPATPTVEVPQPKVPAEPTVQEVPKEKVFAKPKTRRSTQPQPPRSKPNDMLAERKLIASAQREIRSKNYTEAKSLLKQHKQEFPNGILGPERQAAQAIVNCLEPSGTNGKAIARRFLERHASSPLAARVRSVCEIPE